MPAPQVSHQALLNEAQRHKTWESLEATLMNLITTGQVLDYKHEGEFVTVTLNGTNRPVKLPVSKKAPPKSEVSPDSFEEAPAASKTATAVLDRPKAAPKVVKPPKAAQKGVQAPVGVVALVGLRTESYDAHVRRIVRFALEPLGLPIESSVESCVQDWYESLK
jgi:hypothetical protein